MRSCRKYCTPTGEEMEQQRCIQPTHFQSWKPGWLGYRTPARFWLLTTGSTGSIRVQSYCRDSFLLACVFPVSLIAWVSEQIGLDDDRSDTMFMRLFQPSRGVWSTVITFNIPEQPSEAPEKLVHSGVGLLLRKDCCKNNILACFEKGQSTVGYQVHKAKQD